MTDRILRLPTVMARTGLSRATIYRRMSQDFPKPVRLTVRSIGWRESDISTWIASLAQSGASVGASEDSNAA